MWSKWPPLFPFGHITFTLRIGLPLMSVLWMTCSEWMTASLCPRDKLVMLEFKTKMVPSTKSSFPPFFMTHPLGTTFHAMPKAFLCSCNALCKYCLIALSRLLTKIEHKPPAYRQCPWKLPTPALRNSLKLSVFFMNMFILPDIWQRISRDLACCFLENTKWSHLRNLTPVLGLCEIAKAKWGIVQQAGGMTFCLCVWQKRNCAWPLTFIFNACLQWTNHRGGRRREWASAQWGWWLQHALTHTGTQTH